MASFVNISEAASLGLHTVALLATNPRRRFTNQEIAEMLGASAHHLAKVMQRLVKVGLVDSIRGPQGGFLLGKPAGEVTLLSVYEAIEGPVEETACLAGNPGCRGPVCILGQVIQSAHRQVRAYLEKTKLAELAENFGWPVATEQQKAQT